MKPSSKAFQVENCPLPETPLHPDTPKEIAAAYGRLVAAMVPLNVARSQTKVKLQAIMVEMLGRFDLKKIESLKALRVEAVQLLQDELDIRTRFDAWLDGYSKSLDTLHDQLHARREKSKAEVREGILSAAGFDDEAKSQADKADAIVSIHPDVRRQSSNIDQVEGIRKSSLSLSNTSGPHALNHERRLALIEAIREELGTILQFEGLGPTVLYAYRHGAECVQFVDPADR
jgi:hypothetical protein